MKILVVLAHPNSKSFNHAIAETSVSVLKQMGHEVIFHDLHKENFDPMVPAAEIPDNAPIPDDIDAYCQELATAAGIIIIHPDWWGQPPAILKGWVDRVFRSGVAYEFLEGDSGEGVPHGLLQAKAALVFNTSNTSAEREENSFGDPLERIWKDCIFDLCGVTAFYRKMFRIVITSTEAERKQWLEEVKEAVRHHFPG